MRVLLGLLLAPVVLGMTAWAAGALYYAPLPPGVRAPLAIGFAALTVLAFAVLPRRGRTLAAFLVAFGAIVAWFLAIPASNDRDWQPEVAKLAYATVNGNLVTLHNIRNFAYRTETDFTPRWYDKTFDLTKLDRGDIVASYWASPHIAHLFVTFGFGDDHVAMSIETRKEKGEGYSTVAGFFREYELYYVVADERDLIGVRTTYRQPNEDVYVFRTTAPIVNLQRLFMDYVRELNELRDRPKWYNTLTHNCTTGIFMHTKVNQGRIPFTWKILLSGHTPEAIYDGGRLDRSLPFDELKKRSWVNDRARQADGGEDFSRLIRVGMP
jgi:hypothetical protein